MTYIFTALKPEAQAFVDMFTLQKERIGNFSIFSNTHMVVIISGLGVQNMQICCEYMQGYFNISKDDIVINIGIAGADSNYKIGQLVEIGTVEYHDEKVVINSDVDKNLTCLDFEAKSDDYEIVDMESYGFYEGFSEHKNRYIFKVISDHFQPEIVTKDSTKRLIFNNIDKILKRVKR